MNVSLTPELDGFVQKAFAGGRYASASEVVRSGFRLLAGEEADREAKRGALRAWIQEAIDDPPLASRTRTSSNALKLG